MMREVRELARARKDRALADDELGAKRAGVIPCRIRPPAGKDPRIVVHRDEGDEKVGSIWIPDQHRAKANSATVVAVNGHSDFRVGDRVLFGKYEGVEVEMDGYRYLIIRERDIKALLADAVGDRSRHCPSCTCDDKGAA